MELSPAEHEALVARLRAAGCVYAEDEAAVLASSASPASLATLVARRIAGEPLEQVVGWAEFCDLRLAVAPGVFVPRLRTTAVVTAALPLLGRGDVVVDLGCGVGAIGAALRCRVDSLELHSVDVDPAAVAVARSNLPTCAVYEGDLFEPLPASLRGRVALVVANAPYVPSDEVALMPREARDHEHLIALDGGPDGLDVQRRLLASVRGWLRPGGHVLIETSPAQLPGTLAAMAAVGLETRSERDDDVDGTVAVGTSPVAGV